MKTMFLLLVTSILVSCIPQGNYQGVPMPPYRDAPVKFESRTQNPPVCHTSRCVQQQRVVQERVVFVEKPTPIPQPYPVYIERPQPVFIPIQRQPVSMSDPVYEPRCRQVIQMCPQPVFTPPPWGSCRQISMPPPCYGNPYHQ